ncbi:unnamed protein product [Heterosigma akashiwo]
MLRPYQLFFVAFCWLVASTLCFTTSGPKGNAVTGRSRSKTAGFRKRSAITMNNDFQAYNFGLDDPSIDFLWDSDYSSVHVYVATKPGTEKDFIEESIQNAKNSVLEEGVSRFDILQKVNDPTQFQLLEVYNNRGGGIAHKDTDHYKKWRANVADMMALDRRAATYRPLFPVPSEVAPPPRPARRSGPPTARLRRPPRRLGSLSLLPSRRSSSRIGSTIRASLATHCTCARRR